jgi:phosphopantothenoylcysteine synthetase/decarboxylase
VTTPGERGLLYVVVCAAGPAGEVGQLVELAQDRGWTVQIIATPAALDFIDVPALEAQTGRPVKSQYRKPGEPWSPEPDAIIVAPATFNTINKWANGISDNYALGILAEAAGQEIPIVVLPFVNSALAERTPLQLSIATLRAEGIQILLGPGEVEPHPPRAGGAQQAAFPWKLALDTIERGRLD